MASTDVRRQPARQLTVRLPNGGSTAVPLASDRLTLGRAGDNQLHFADLPGLSRHHLVFERRVEDWYVRDLGSRNGTYVNDVRIAEAQRLKPGDRINAGELCLEFDGQSRGRDTVLFFEPNPASQHSTTHITDLAGALREGTRLAGRDSNTINALIRIGQALSETVALSELFERVLELSIEAVGADRGILLTMEGSELVPQAVKGGRFQISTTVRNRVMNDRASVLVHDANSDADFGGSESIVRQQIRSIMAVPLQTGDQVIGLIYVDVLNLLRPFRKEDLSLLTVMANIAGIRIAKARLAEVEEAERVHSRELEQAAEIQTQLLPASAPEVPGYDIAGRNLPCRTVGGDYFDYFRAPDGRVALLVGDVAGKGMPAALLMSSLQARLQVMAESAMEPAELVARLNRGLLAKCPGNRFITFFYSLLDPASGSLMYCNAGHNPPLLLRANGRVERLTTGGPILGLFGALPFQQASVHIEPGDVLVMFSDGVTEACAPESEDEFGERRLARYVSERRDRPATQIIDDIIAGVRACTAGAPFQDDVTLVIARRTGAADPSHLDPGL